MRNGTNYFAANVDITIMSASVPISLSTARLLEYYVAGCRGEDGRLSHVRRFFCLFVTFDFLFTSLLWLICLVLANHTLVQVIEQQIRDYSIETSIFDIVLLAASRFVPLLLFYGLIHMDHWWAVALTTTSSCAFLVAKVFFYSWDASQANDTFTVTLILCSFVIAWSELWLLDSRVIPRERQAAEIESRFFPHERTSLLCRTPFSNDDRASSYYSPVATPSESECEEEANSYYSVKAKETLEAALNEMNQNDWKVEKPPSNDVIIYSRRASGGRKIYKLTASIDASALVLFTELFIYFEQVPEWNPSLLSCRILQRIDDHTDIVYQVAAEGGGGLVSSRDFVDLRHWVKRGEDYFGVGVSVTHSQMPPQKTSVRGENGICAWYFEYNPDDPNVCRLHWLLNTDLKGWLPQYLIDQTLATVMMDCICHVRRRLQILSEA